MMVMLAKFIVSSTATIMTPEPVVKHVN